MNMNEIYNKSKSILESGNEVLILAGKVMSGELEEAALYGPVGQMLKQYSEYLMLVGDKYMQPGMTDEELDETAELFSEGIEIIGFGIGKILGKVLAKYGNFSKEDPPMEDFLRGLEELN